MVSCTKIFDGKPCECFHYTDPLHRERCGKMRMILEATLDNMEQFEAHILVPIILQENELDLLHGLWITEIEKERGLLLGCSCISSSWHAGHKDSTNDNLITNNYDYLIPAVLTKRQQSIIEAIVQFAHEECSYLEKKLSNESGSSEHAAQIHVELDKEKYILVENEALLKNYKLLQKNQEVHILDDNYKVLLVEPTTVMIHLQNVESNNHLAMHLKDYFAASPELIEERVGEKSSLEEQISTAHTEQEPTKDNLNHDAELIK